MIPLRAHAPLEHFALFMRHTRDRSSAIPEIVRLLLSMLAIHALRNANSPQKKKRHPFAVRMRAVDMPAKTLAANARLVIGGSSAPRAST